AQLPRVLRFMLDEAEFLSPHGIRAVSRYHREHPYVLSLNGMEHRVDYEPAESASGLFGGNSNWRGPVWFPVNYLLIESLQKFHHFYGDGMKVPCPTGSGRMLNLWQVAAELSRRLTRIFLRGKDGRRPVHGGTETLLAATRRRARRLIAPERLFTVVTRKHERFYRSELADAAPGTVVVQPEGRGTAPAILYALRRVAVVAPESPLVLLPSDHYVSDDAAFMARVESALEAAQARPGKVIL